MFSATAQLPPPARVSALDPSRPGAVLAELHIDDEISDLIEGALDRPTHIRVHSHLVHCRRCRQLLYRTYETLALLAALGSLEA
jgi:hypothetical protein